MDVRNHRDIPGNEDKSGNAELNQKAAKPVDKRILIKMMRN